MKRFALVILALCVVFVVLGCTSMEGVVKDAAEDVITGKPSGARVGGIDFKKDEILAASEEENLMDNTFYVAKILTPATAATKNQTEVLFVDSGEKHWSIAVIPSHKASKGELTLGGVVFYNYHYTWDELDLDDESYRKSGWYLGRISSTDELFKDVVEVNGEKMKIIWLRIPEEAVE